MDWANSLGLNEWQCPALELSARRRTSNIGTPQSAVDGIAFGTWKGLVASVLLIAILLSVLLVVGGIVYLLAQRLPKRSPEPPRKPANRWLVIGYIGTG